MEFKDFVNNFADQFEDMDISALKEETEFKTLYNWSSLTALMVIAMIDEEYSVKVNGDDIRKSKTLKDLYEIVKSRC